MDFQETLFLIGQFKKQVNLFPNRNFSVPTEQILLSISTAATVYKLQGDKCLCTGKAIFLFSPRGQRETKASLYAICSGIKTISELFRFKN